MMALGDNPRICEVHAHPVGRDAIDKVLLQMGRSRHWVTNPLVSSLRLRTVARLAEPLVGPRFADALLELLADHPSVVTTGSSRTQGRSEDPWWRTAVFYQVYPRSFADSDGDGIGDLRGIIDHLDHLRDLGVDCLWLSPIFDSPNEDAGYDVRDYRAVMSEMGTLDDLDALIAGCHERGMRIILDLVVNHTSHEHAWFQAAIADPDGPYGDYYHLRPGRPGEDGTGPPPNNWTSFFGGSAWRWIPQARRWALHLFAEGQMDLNWENPAVRAEVADIVRWWRSRGIDGFRLDVINYISKRPGLPDGDEAIGALIGFPGIEHYFFGPRLHEYLHELRGAGFTRDDSDPPPTSTVRGRHDDRAVGEPQPPDRVGVMVGETPGVGIEMGRLLSGASREELDLVFNFDVLDGPGRIRWDDYRYDLAYLKDFLIEQQSRIGADDRVALFLDNHDNPRMLSKVLGPRDRDPVTRSAVAKLLATIQLTLPGTPFLYQGQEIGAVDQRFDSIDQLRDVESLNRHRELLADGVDAVGALAGVVPGARDHARVPMRWQPGPGHGFTTGVAWQPSAEGSSGFTVEEQQDDPDSVLSFHRDLIRLRRQHPTLADGAVRFPDRRSRRWFGWVLADRDGRDEWLVELNLTDRRIRRPRHFVGRTEVELASLAGPGFHRPGVTRRGPWMGPYETVIARITH